MPQYEQIAIGNQLLQVALLLFSAALLQSGGFSPLEHPRQPKLLVLAASIWKLSYVKWMLQSPAVEVYSFEQGKHGQVSRKPTSVLLVRLAAVKEYLSKYQGGEIKQSVEGPLAGVAADGTFVSA